MQLMSKSEYNDELWDEIPSRAYIALGRRGQEAIDLHQCFRPTCSNTEEDKVHPIKRKIQSETIEQDGKVKMQEIHYLIHCEHCVARFLLVLNRHWESGNLLFDRVSAANPETMETYGEIGIVQYRNSKNKPKITT